jgi:Xaa-Pro aminopeptidase
MIWPTAQEWGFRDEGEAVGLEVGHGVGLSNHEKPFITRGISINHPEVLLPGMHFARETFAGAGNDGARIESQIIVTESGNRVITKWPCEKLMVCNPR